MVGLVGKSNLKLAKFASFNLVMAISSFYLGGKSAVFSQPVWPAEYPLRPLEISKSSNMVKKCEFRESQFNLDD